MTNGIGIDWGVKTLLTCSNGYIVHNFIYNKEYKELLHEEYKIKETMRPSKDRQKAIFDVKRFRQSMETTTINNAIDTIIKWKPSFIAIEDLDPKAINKYCRQSHFRLFRSLLIKQCKKHNIELRQVNRFFASSQTCSRCGEIKHDLKLSDRTYVCNKCGFEIDRDLNASLNIRDCNNYTLL